MFALVDSGATHGLLDQRIFSRYFADKKLLTTKISGLTTATGSSSRQKVAGIAKLTIWLTTTTKKRVKYNLEAFVISGIKIGLIIGQSFFKKHLSSLTNEHILLTNYDRRSHPHRIALKFHETGQQETKKSIK